MEKKLKTPEEIKNRLYDKGLILASDKADYGDTFRADEVMRVLNSYEELVAQLLGGVSEENLEEITREYVLSKYPIHTDKSKPDCGTRMLCRQSFEDGFKKALSIKGSNQQWVSDAVAFAEWIAFRRPRVQYKHGYWWSFQNHITTNDLYKEFKNAPTEQSNNQQEVCLLKCESCDQEFDMKTMIEGEQWFCKPCYDELSEDPDFRGDNQQEEVSDAVDFLKWTRTLTYIVLPFNKTEIELYNEFKETNP